MTNETKLKCGVCGRRGAFELNRLPDGRFACSFCYGNELITRFNPDELRKMVRFCRAVAANLDQLGDWQADPDRLAKVKAAIERAADESDFHGGLAFRWWQFVEADFEFNFPPPGRLQ